MEQPRRCRELEDDAWNGTSLSTRRNGDNGRVGVLVMPRVHRLAPLDPGTRARLADAGYTVALPLLAGHGTHPGGAWRRLAGRTGPRDVERAFDWLRRADRPDLRGRALHGRHSGPVDGWSGIRKWRALITVNACVRHPQELAMRILGRDRRAPLGPTAVANDVKCPGVDEMAYKQAALALCPPARVADEGREARPAQRHQSGAALFVHGRPRGPAEEPARDSGTPSPPPDKTFVELDDCYHVATMDYGKEKVFAKTLEFIAGHRSAPKV